MKAKKLQKDDCFAFFVRKKKFVSPFDDGLKACTQKRFIRLSPESFAHKSKSITKKFLLSLLVQKSIFSRGPLGGKWKCLLKIEKNETWELCEFPRKLFIACRRRRLSLIFNFPRNRELLIRLAYLHNGRGRRGWLHWQWRWHTFVSQNSSH